MDSYGKFFWRHFVNFYNKVVCIYHVPYNTYGTSKTLKRDHFEKAQKMLPKAKKKPQLALK